jgi:phosphatidylethanolamine-binding protein (PEBP) family uncharacterized protein
MKIFYNGKIIKNNEFIKVTETKSEPLVNLNLDPNYYYTLIMYDPDAVGGTYIHWLKVNITNNDINTGNIIISYKGPSPPPKTGIHHYIFELYKQDRENNSEKITERLISIAELKKNLKINTLIDKIQFISENKSGGKKCKTQKIKYKRKKIKLNKSNKKFT